MQGLAGIDKLNVAAVGRAGDHARRLFGARPDRDAGGQRPLLPPDQAFEQQTGCPVLVNTSFNIRGEPIVCTPEDAYRCFMGTHMDALVLENTLLLKDEQSGARPFDADQYKRSFHLD